MLQLLKSDFIHKKYTHLVSENNVASVLMLRARPQACNTDSYDSRELTFHLSAPRLNGNLNRVVAASTRSISDIKGTTLTLFIKFLALKVYRAFIS